MFEAGVTWAKEYGDVLGTVGFLFALTTIIVTNGRVILQRFRGQSISAPDLLAPLNSTNQLAEVKKFAVDYGDKTPIAVATPKLLGEVEDHFSEGLADDLIADLQHHGFAIPDISSVNQLIDQGHDLASVAVQLNVPYILTSSVRRQDNRVRINTQLVSRNGSVIWSQRYNSEGSDLMAIQEDTASRIVGEIADIVKPNDVPRDPISGRAYATREQALRVVSSSKSRLTAFLLCVSLLGIFGVHRFYVGRPYTGILYILTAGLFLFGWLIDSILIASGMFADGKGKPLAFWRPDPLRNLSKEEQ